MNSRGVLLVFIAWFCQRDMALPHFEARAKAPCPSHNVTLLWTLAGFRKFIWLRDPQHFLLFVHDIDTNVHELVLSYSRLDSKVLVRVIRQHDCENQQNPTVIGTALIQMQLQRFSLRAPRSSVRKLIWLRGPQHSLFSVFKILIQNILLTYPLNYENVILECSLFFENTVYIFFMVMWMLWECCILSMWMHLNITASVNSKGVRGCIFQRGVA